MKILAGMDGIWNGHVKEQICFNYLMRMRTSADYYHKGTGLLNSEQWNTYLEEVLLLLDVIATANLFVK